MKAELNSWPLAGKTIVIIGPPASGKTTLAKSISESTGTGVVSTDDYMEHGYKDSLYVMLDDLAELTEPKIIEGMQGYRLLRKGVELDCFYPDIVIELSVTQEQVERVYRTERISSKLPKLAAFNKMHQTILESYKAMDNPRPPKWIRIQNEF